MKKDVIVMKKLNSEVTTKALTVRKETSLTVLQNLTISVVRSSSKAILATFALTLLNLVV